MDEPKKVLMMFGCRRKIVTLGCNVQNLQSFLQCKAMELFEVTCPLVVQYKDQDFDEWVDMDEEYIPTHKEKLLVITRDGREPATQDLEKVTCVYNISQV